MSRRALSVALVAGLLLAVLLCTSPASATGKLRSCPHPTYAPPNGGYALIITHLRVRGVTCLQGAKIAGDWQSGQRHPGWHCQWSKTVGPTRCSKGSKRVQYVFEGDAG